MSFTILCRNLIASVVFMPADWEPDSIVSRPPGPLRLTLRSIWGRFAVRDGQQMDLAAPSDGSLSDLLLDGVPDLE